MAAPGPPVAKLQCTASLAGARPARFTSVPGRATVAFKVGFHFVKAKSLRDPRIRLWRKRGLAQLIPPPAFGRRFIPGVMTRCRYGSATWRRNVPRYRGHAKCVPDTVPDWLLAPGQTKWGARYGPCRWRDKRKCPFRRKGGGRGTWEGGRNPPCPPGRRSHAPREKPFHKTQEAIFPYLRPHAPKEETFHKNKGGPPALP